jgi:hypothetical protein
VYGTDDAPAPSAVPPDAGLRVPNASLHVVVLDVENRKKPVDDDALGFALPASAAPLLVIDDAAPVVTTGVPGAVNDCTVPKRVPDAFVTPAQKK